MSEEMIQRQRTKLGLPPNGSSPSASMPSGGGARSLGKGNLMLRSPHMKGSGEAPVPQTPQELAAAETLSEDAQIQRFIHRLQRRDDSHPMADASSGPTVPTALSRRMLQRQGVGYLDDTVASTISASADRFLATVLQQAKACRDQRLEGAEMAREAARHRKRHIQHYAEDADDRKRRRGELDDAREKVQLKIIATAEALKKGGGSKDSDDKKKKKKKKAPTSSANAAEDSKEATNGDKSVADDPKDLDDDDEESYDSIDEEEDYYQEKLGDVPRAPLKGDEEEEDDTLRMKDLVRPLEAWDFHLTGKEALETLESESLDENGEVEDDEKGDRAASTTEENGNNEGLSADGEEGSKNEHKTGDETDNDTKRKSGALSPVNTATS